MELCSQNLSFTPSTLLFLLSTLDSGKGMYPVSIVYSLVDGFRPLLFMLALFQSRVHNM